MRILNIEVVGCIVRITNDVLYFPRWLGYNFKVEDFLKMYDRNSRSAFFT